MNRRNEGFTLIELLIVIAIFGVVLAGTTQMIVSMLTSSRQQSKITESNIEGIIGLELLRQDLAKAGYGLPWNWNALAAPAPYSEASSGTAALLNDAPNLPKGIVSMHNTHIAGYLDGTDYLVIRAANVAVNPACSKWILVSTNGTPADPWSSTTPTAENFVSNDRVLLLQPGSPSTEETARFLVTLSGGAYSTQWSSQANLSTTMTTTGIAYGIDDSHDPRRPFNRADYYLKQPAAGMPQRCAPGTGILYKAVMNQNSDGTLNEMPLLDCVADMQVLFRYDPKGYGSASLTATSDISTWTAKDIRDEVKEVRVYILTHEGQRDTSFTYPTSTVGVGTEYGTSVGGRNFDLTGIANWRNYRWKIYTLVVKLDNLGPNANQ